MAAQEQVEVRLGAMVAWRDLHFAIKGFSGEPGASYAKVIVRSGDESQVVKLGLGESAGLREGVSIRLDEVPPPSRPQDGPVPTGAGSVRLTVVTTDDGGAR